MNKQNKAIESEPTMDEILASIKSIISEDVRKSYSAPPAKPMNVNRASPVSIPLSAPKEEADVLELTQMLSDDGSVVNIHSFDIKEGLEPKILSQESKKHQIEPSAQPRLQETITPSPTSTPSEATPHEVMSENTFSESIKALKSLETLSKPTVKQALPTMESGKTLETLMEDILRPMLRQWIDANLPSLVKVIVNEQIEKVIKAHLKDG